MKIFLFSFSTAVVGFGQNRITITDSEIEFSLELPVGWETQNDDFYFHVFNPEWERAHLSITYYNENTPRKLDEIVDTRLIFSYPKIEGFKHLDTDLTTIDGVETISVHYQFMEDGIKMLSRETIFIKEGQIFYLNAAVEKNYLESRMVEFDTVVNSFQCRYL